MSSQFKSILRISQASLALFALAISSYAASIQQNNQSYSPSFWGLNGYLIFTTAFAFCSAVYMHFFTTKNQQQQQPHSKLQLSIIQSFLLLSLNALFHLSAFISLSILTAKGSSVTSHTHTADIVDAVILAFGYVVWVAEATMVGLEMSKVRRSDREVMEIKGAM